MKLIIHTIHPNQGSIFRNELRFNMHKHTPNALVSLPIGISKCSINVFTNWRYFDFYLNKYSIHLKNKKFPNIASARKISKTAKIM